MKNSIFKNKRVYFDYDIQDKLEAGIVLTGTEVKSIKNGKVNINGTYCVFQDNELFIKGMDIAVYDEGSYLNHDPKRDRKLLLHRKELNKLKGKLEERGLTIVPIKLYLNDRNIYKVEIGIAKGRKAKDKRDYIREREIKKELRDII